MIQLAIYLNAVFSTIIIIAIVSYCNKIHRHNVFIRIISYLMVLMCGAIVLQTLSGSYACINLIEIFLNGVLCIAVVAAKGNIYLGVNRRKRKEIFISK